jgi:hypothetical protein
MKAIGLSSAVLALAAAIPSIHAQTPRIDFSKIEIKTT